MRLSIEEHRILEAALVTAVNVGYGSGVSPAVANDSFACAHDLGLIPEWVDGVVSGNGTVWWTAADKALWTATHVRLRCNMANTKVYIRTETREQRG